jgi:hypothetical protein
VLAENKVDAAVEVARATTLEDAEVTAPVLMVFRLSIRPVYEAAAGNVTEMADAELNIINVSVSGTVYVAAVMGVVTAATAYFW